jgi:hypothetical protein
VWRHFEIYRYREVTWPIATVTKQYGSGGVTVTIKRRYHVNKHEILLADFQVLIHEMKDDNKLSQGNKNSDYSLLEYNAVLFGIDGLEPCFSIYMSSRNSKMLENVMRNFK